MSIEVELEVSFINHLNALMSDTVEVHGLKVATPELIGAAGGANMLVRLNPNGELETSGALKIIGTLKTVVSGGKAGLNLEPAAGDPATLVNGDLFTTTGGSLRIKLANTVRTVVTDLSASGPLSVTYSGSNASLTIEGYRGTVADVAARDALSSPAAGHWVIVRSNLDGKPQIFVHSGSAWVAHMGASYRGNVANIAARDALASVSAGDWVIVQEDETTSTPPLVNFMTANGWFALPLGGEPAALAGAGDFAEVTASSSAATAQSLVYAGTGFTWSSSNSGTHYIQIQPELPTNLTEYWLMANVLATAPKNFRLLGSDSETFDTYTVLDTRTNVTVWASGTYNVFRFTNRKAFTYYRLEITANNGGATHTLHGLKFLSPFVRTSNGALYARPSTAPGAVVVLGTDSRIAPEVMADGSDSSMYLAQDKTTTTGLTFGYKGGKIKNDNIIRDVPAGTLAMTASSTNYVYADPTVASNWILKNTTGYPQGMIPLFKVVTSGSAITDVTDDRTPLGLSGATGGDTVPIASGVDGKPDPSQKVFMFLADKEYSYSANLNGSVVKVKSNPSASYVLTVYKNDVSQGTITIATSGAVTYAVSAFTQAAGDIVDIFAPSVQDATLADLYITLVAAS